MKHWLIMFLLVVMAAPLRAQDVSRIFTVEAPLNYHTTYGTLSWSPDGSLIAIGFTKIDEGNSPGEKLWQVFDVQTGDRLYEFGDLMAWYANGLRLLVRPVGTGSPQILDAKTGTALAQLENTGTSFSAALIVDTIATFDEEARILRIYDAETGAPGLTLDNAAGLPIYSPDGTRMAVGVEEAGVQIYDASNLSLQYSIEGYKTGQPHEQSWSPDGRQFMLVAAGSLHTVVGPRYIWTLGEGLSAPLYNFTSGIVWSPDGTQIAAGSDFTKVRIYDSTTGELLDTIRGFAGGPTGIILWHEQYLISRSGDVAFGPPPVISLWNFEQRAFVFERGIDIVYDFWIEGDELVIFQPWYRQQHIVLGTGEVIRDIEFEDVLNNPSPDRRWVISTIFPTDSENVAPIVVYRFDPLEWIATLDSHTEIVRYVAWSPDSIHFASIGGPDRVIVWKVIDAD